MTIILFCDMFIGKEGVLVSIIQDGTGDGPRLREWGVIISKYVMHKWVSNGERTRSNFKAYLEIKFHQNRKLHMC